MIGGCDDLRGHPRRPGVLKHERGEKMDRQTAQNCVCVCRRGVGHLQWLATAKGANGAWLDRGQAPA